MIADRKATPRNVEELCAFLAECNASGRAVSIEGGKTLSGIGRSIEPDVALATTKLSKMLTHEFHDLTCSAQAGMRVANLNKELGKHGQFVPLDVPLQKKATIGGSLAAGWLGPRRHKYGRARDFVIGSQVALADGTLVKAGGMVVKNVSGYDMSKLYAGSFGTLGVITQLNFKTLPAPQVRRILVASLPERTRPRAVANLAEVATAPDAAFCIEGFGREVYGEDGIDGRAVILLEGTQQLVDRATLEIRTALGRAGIPESTVVDTGAGEVFDCILDACIANKGTSSITYRSLGLPGDVEARATALRDAAQKLELYTDVLLDVMNGDVFIRISHRDDADFESKLELCHQAIREVDPKAVILAGDSPKRAALEPWGQTPEGFSRMLELKRRFDPKKTLNPGRFLGGI